MKNVTVMSIPRSGTRFYLYFCMFILNVPTNYIHFWDRKKKDIQEYLLNTDDVIIVPIRSYAAMDKSFSRFPDLRAKLDEELLPNRELFTPYLEDYGAHFMDIEKNENTVSQFDALLKDLNMDWTPEIVEYIENWERIGAYPGSCPKSNKLFEKFKVGHGWEKGNG